MLQLHVCRLRCCFQALTPLVASGEEKSGSFARLLYAVGPTFCTHQGLSLHCEICMR